MAQRAIFVAPFGELADAARARASLWPKTEAAGFDGFFLWDHIVYSVLVTHVADPWVAMAAVAAATKRVPDRPAGDADASAGGCRSSPGMLGLLYGAERRAARARRRHCR